MNKITKRYISAFVALCVALSGTVCYAGKGRKQKVKHVVPATATTATPDVKDADPEEQKITALCNEVRDLLYQGGVSPARKGPILLSESLKNKCYDYTDDDGIFRCIGAFAGFFEIALNHEIKNEYLHDGMILFLSIIKRLQWMKGKPDPDRDFSCAVALLTLYICDLGRAGIYEKWYRLLEPYTTPEFKKIKKSEQRELLNRQLRTSSHDKLKRQIVISYVLEWLGKFRNSVCVAFFALNIGLFESEIGEPQLRANKAIHRMQRDLSWESIGAADEAVEELCKLVPGFMERMCLKDEQKAEIDKMLADDRARVAKAKEVYGIKQDCLMVFNTLGESVREMKKKNTPESVDRAREACKNCYEVIRSYTDKYEVSFEDAPISFAQCIVEYCEEIECWATQQCRIVADVCIEALSKEYSDDAFKSAVDAQKSYEEALTKCPPDAVKFAKNFAELRKHYKENQDKITKIRETHERQVAAEALERERKQKADDRKLEVDLARQQKTERKIREAEALRVPKEKASYEVVFLHDPCNRNPLEYLESHSQYIGEWNAWYDKAVASGAPAGTKIRWNAFKPMYKNLDGRDLDIEIVEGNPRLSEYRGRDRGETAGLRIVWYREGTSKRIVVLYVGKPFGEECHNNPWEPLLIRSNWVYESVCKLKAKK